LNVKIEIEQLNVKIEKTGLLGQRIAKKQLEDVVKSREAGAKDSSGHLHKVEEDDRIYNFE
jgi:hypothetical protein